ncbi:hypothetical protein FACS1894199_18350 [Bacteroidia bacterium]|nr:hypothetical protein FACS1894199_18350 [Bacteroidia bacterium]
MKRKLLLFFLFLSSSFSIASAAEIAREDSVIFRKFWKYAEEKSLLGIPIDKRIPIIGEFFLGSPYVGGMLNTGVPELPTINLRKFDCVLFVEAVIAFALLDRYDDMAIETYVNNIIKLRYRNGELNYVSRLHYSSDWLYEMVRLKVLRDVTHFCGGEVFPINVSFMTEHAKKYYPISHSKKVKADIKIVEEEINKRTYYYIPQDNLDTLSPKFRTGDVLLITTNIKGLDTSHIGFAYKKKDKIYLMHASETAKKVVISELTLGEYIQGNKSQTGVMVGRINR